MALDQSAPVAADASGASATGKTFADVADTALHYIAAGAIVGVVAAFAWYGKVSTDLFVVVITGAAAAVGIKLKN